MKQKERRFLVADSEKCTRYRVCELAYSAVKEKGFNRYRRKRNADLAGKRTIMSTIIEINLINEE